MGLTGGRRQLVPDLLGDLQAGIQGMKGAPHLVERGVRGRAVSMVECAAQLVGRPLLGGGVVACRASQSLAGAEVTLQEGARIHSIT